MLLPEGGPTLRRAIGEGSHRRAWEPILQAYAALQIESTAHLGELAALGLHDRRLEQLPKYFQAVLSDKDLLLLGQKDGLSRAQYQRLLALTTQFKAICSELAAAPIPSATLEHGDFHDANIFYAAGRFKIFDWGDASLSHPFFSLINPLRMSAYQLEIEEDDPQLTWIRDAYFEPWTQTASRAEILEAWNLAHYLVKFQRAFNWATVTQSVGADAMHAYRDAVPGWLEDFLNHVPND